MSKLKFGKYRHYKGTEYDVLGVARHTETKEELVVYRARYDSEEFGPRALWVRPLSMFLDTVTVDGKKIPRFEYLK
jgi:hypothetical protein